MRACVRARAVGHTARFCVDLSGNCQRHHTVGKDTCPTCYEFDFESGDCLLFDGHVDACVCHGVLAITDKIVPGAAEALPEWMADRRVSVQMRGRGSEDEGRGGLGERATKEGAAWRARQEGRCASVEGRSWVRRVFSAVWFDPRTVCHAIGFPVECMCSRDVCLAS